MRVTPIIPKRWCAKPWHLDSLLGSKRGVAWRVFDRTRPGPLAVCLCIDKVEAQRIAEALNKTDSRAAIKRATSP